MDSRAYLVMGVDENGDPHLFASDDFARAEATLAQYRESLEDVRAIWWETALRE
jgi:hypothetical protein